MVDIRMNAGLRELSESELAQLLKPADRSQSVKLLQEDGKLIAKPLGIPMWAAVACAVTPVIALDCFLVGRFLRNDFHPMNIVGLLISFPVAAFGIGLIHWINSKELSKGDFFVLDTERRILSLPRSRCQFRQHVRGLSINPRR